jgi:hypothetical protein
MAYIGKQGDQRFARQVILTDKDGYANTFDDSMTKNLIILEQPHSNLHDGNLYSAYTTGIAGAGEKLEIAIKTPKTFTSAAIRCHCVCEYGASVAAKFKIIEDVIGFDETSGKAFTPFNRHRDSSKTSNAQWVRYSTISSAFGYSGGTTVTEEQYSILATRSQGEWIQREWILKNNVVTVFSVLSQAATNRIYLQILWYEHQDL